VKLKARVARLEEQAARIPPVGQIDMVVCMPAGCPAAENRPDGAYPNAEGNVVNIVYSGADPDPELLAALRPRMSQWGILVVGR
jgi:hypothetical protein